MKKSEKNLRRFSSGVSRISRVWGRHSPTRFPQGQNERKANFGTAVESCSKKLPLSSAALVCGYTGLLHQYSDCGGVFCPLFTTTTVKRGRFGKRSGIFFVFPVCSLQQSGGVVCQRFLKMGAIITTGRAGGLHRPPWGLLPAEPIGSSNLLSTA